MFRAVHKNVPVLGFFGRYGNCSVFHTVGSYFYDFWPNETLEMSNIYI